MDALSALLETWSVSVIHDCQSDHSTDTERYECEGCEEAEHGSAWVLKEEAG